MAASGQPDTLALGVLGRPHGVRGELVFHAFNPGGVQLADLDLPLAVALRRGSATRSASVVAARPFQDGALVVLEGIDSREAAAAFTGYDVCVPRAALPPLAADECYTADLIGCAVFDQEGRSRGQVMSAFWNGTHEVLSVVDPGGQETLVPVLRDFLCSIDLVNRRIVVDPHE
jgi:16S rRNA processing protein RimM